MLTHWLDQNQSFEPPRPDMRLKVDPLRVRSSVPNSDREVEQHVGSQTEKLQQKKLADWFSFWEDGDTLHNVSNLLAAVS